MNDRALLEAAARAAGLTVNVFKQMERDAAGHGDIGLWLSNGNTCWNPLTDDGDALRLAVTVGIAVTPFTGSKVTRASCLGELLDVDEEHGCDPFSATRRAIVRAAAAIGSERG